MANYITIPGFDTGIDLMVDRIDTNHASILNFTSHSIIFSIKKGTLTEAVMSKGHPTDPSQGAWSIEIINGFIRVYLHNNDNTNSLCIQSDQPIANDPNYRVYAYTWDDLNKQFLMYKNGALVACSIITGPNLFSTFGAFTSLRNNTSVITTHPATKNRFSGQMFERRIYLKALTPTEISNITDSIKSTLPDLTGIILTAKNSGTAGRKQVYTISAHGGLEQPITNDTANWESPTWSPDGSKILLFYNSLAYSAGSNYSYLADYNGGNLTPFNYGGYYGTKGSWMNNNYIFVVGYPSNQQRIAIKHKDGSSIGHYYTSGQPLPNRNGITENIQNNPVISPNNNFLITQYTWPFVNDNPAGTYTEGRYSNILYYSTLDSNQNVVATSTMISLPTMSTSYYVGDQNISNNNNIIGFTLKNNTAFSSAMLADGNGGNIRIVVPGNSAFGDIRFGGFSPDSTEMIFSAKGIETGTEVARQLYKCKVDGSSIEQITFDTAYSFDYASWK